MEKGTVMFGNVSALSGAFILTAVLAVSGASAQAATASTDNSCQRSQRTIDMNDYGAVCCRITVNGRSKHVGTNRKKCREKGGTVVSRSLCPRRPRSTDQNGWVCCETDTTPGLGARVVGGKKVSRALMPAAECRKRGNSKVVSRQHCVRKQTRRDRMIECRQRGKGWTWNGSRCVRENLRDRRNP